MRDSNWKVYQTLAFLFFAITVVFFTISGQPWPRPEYVFVGLGSVIALAVLSVRSHTGQISSTQRVTTLSLLFIVAVFIRWSGFSRVILSGSDHEFFVTQTLLVRDIGYIPVGDGLYTQAPFVYLSKTVFMFLSGLPVFELTVFSVLIFSTIPIVVGLCARHVDGPRAELYAAACSTPFFLFLRTSAVLEAEALTLLLFSLIYLFLLDQKIMNKRRDSFLLVGLVAVSLLVHFLYALVIGSILVGLIITRSALNGDFSVGPIRFNKYAAILVVIVSIVTGYRVLYSDFGAQILYAVLAKAATGTVPTNILSVFLPSSGNFGASTAQSGGGGALLRWGPVLIFAAWGLGGFIYTISSLERIRRYSALLSSTVLIGIFTAVFLLLLSTSSTMNIGFRVYYFAAPVGLVFAGVFFRSSFGLLDKGPSVLRVTITAVIVLSVFGYATIGPMTSIGNNVDPRFGQGTFATTATDQQQFDNLDRYLQGDHQVGVKVNRIRTVGSGSIVAPKGPENATITSATENCTHGNRVWATDRFALCLNSTG